MLFTHFKSLLSSENDNDVNRKTFFQTKTNTSEQILAFTPLLGNCDE